MSGETCGVHVRTLYKHLIGDELFMRGRKTLLMFHSQDCGFCHQTLPQLHRASMYLCNYDVWTVDIDTNEALADEFKIEALPTLLLVSSAGKVLKRAEGFHEANAIVDFAS